MSLPENHLITLKRFCDINLYGMYDEVVDQIVSSTNPQWSNKKILDILISLIENDNQLLGLSFLIERLAYSDVLLSSCPNIELFRNGWL